MKSLHQVPTAINKGSTEKALWELSKKGEKSSHLVEIKRGFKRVDIWVETLKMDGFVYLCI